MDLIESAAWPECRYSRIVFVDGCLNASLSDLSALPSSCVLVQEDEAVIFYVPPTVAVGNPVQIISLLSRPVPSALRLQILLGQNARLDIVETTAGVGMSANYFDMILDEGAHLRMNDQVKRSSQTHLLQFSRAILQKNARLSSFSYSEGTLMLRRDWQVFLKGEGAEAELKGVDDLRGNCQTHTRVSMQHLAPSCRSRQHFKKILQDHSRSSFEGKIRIEAMAHASDANQLCQNLLLSDEASAIVKPFLDILADDVAVKHGATFSQPNDDELFYCQSRGIGVLEAKELWRQGFCRELIDAIEIPLMREKL